MKPKILTRTKANHIPLYVKRPFVDTAIFYRIHLVSHENSGKKWDFSTVFSVNWPKLLNACRAVSQDQKSKNGVSIWETKREEKNSDEKYVRCRHHCGSRLC